MKKQSYSNHRRYLWWYHGLLLVFCLATFVGSIINLVGTIDRGENSYSASLLVAISLILLGLYYTVRQFGIKLQDRIIRSEENFRHFELTGKPLDHRLHTSQIIALRFAPDDEFVALCKEAAEKRMSQEEIKKSIKRWRGDYHRI